MSERAEALDKANGAWRKVREANNKAYDEACVKTAKEVEG